LNGVQPGAFGPRFHEVRGDADLAKGDKAGALAEYRAARAMDMGGGRDATLLDLKISDLVADSAPLPATGSPAAAKAPTAQTQAAK
jgi:predicted negative regulator of RcsB-dependent stress response